jgi:hypothetical protein
VSMAHLNPARKRESKGASVKRHLITGASLGLVLGLSAVALATEGGPGSPGVEHNSAAPGLEKAFGLLETAPEGAEPSPFDTETTDVKTPDDEFGLQSDEAQKTSADESSLTAIPGTAGICLEGVSVGTCAPIQDALRGRVAFLDLCGGTQGDHVRLSGLVPDGVTTVEVVDATGTQSEVTVDDNVYSVELPEPPTSVRPQGLPTQRWPGEQLASEKCAQSEAASK